MKDDIKKIIKIIKFTATVATVAMTIYSLIPKSDKITDIDTLPLETYGAKADEAAA